MDDRHRRAARAGEQPLGVFQSLPAPGAVGADADLDLAVGMAVFVLVMVGDDHRRSTGRGGHGRALYEDQTGAVRAVF